MACINIIWIDLDELLHDLLDWTRMYTVRGEQTRYVKPDKDVEKDFGSRSYKFVPKSNDDAGAKATETADIAGRAPEHEPSCWKCHKVGHVPKDCPVKHKGAVKCFSCQEEGHFARQCPKRRTTNSVSEQREIASHPYEKCGTVNGQSVKVLIDTGSHYSLIKTSIDLTMYCLL